MTLVPASNASSGTTAKTAYLQDQEASGTAGGTATTAAWTARVLNTTVNDPSSIVVSLTTNTVTLGAGTYFFDGSAPFYDWTGRAQLRVQNTTDASTVGLGPIIFSAVNCAITAVVTGTTVITANKAFQLQYWCTATAGTSDLGIAGSFGTEVYACLLITKIA